MADAKVTELTATTVVQRTDLLAIVDDPGGTPVTKRVTKEDAGIPSSVRLTGDLSSTTVTTNVTSTGMSFSVENGKAYRFHFTVLYRSAATTTGLRLSVNTPAVTLLAAVGRMPNSSSGTTTATIQATVAASDAQAVGLGTPNTTADHLATFEGIIVPSANGTLQLQHASEISGSTVTVKAGTTGMLWRV